MYLKKIVMENFKSFQGKVEIPLLPGYTGITGPNGSGKSNIADAVLFVLGPKSSRVLRAGRQTDLISDIDGRTRGSCSVTLVFDNTGREFPVPSDDVVLRRTVKRSSRDPEGYSSYFYLNGRRSTLSEFESILAHARISADSYNIVQQGDILNIIKMTPVARRRILEDVAGITRYDAEVERAESKMEAVKNDIARIHLLMDEVRKRLSALEEERRHAIEYRKVEADLKVARAQMVYREVQMGREEVRSTALEIERCEKDIAGLEGDISRVREDIGDLDERIAKIDTALESAGSEELRRMTGELDEKRLTRARLDSDADNMEATLKRLKGEVEEACRRLDTTGRGITSRKERIGVLESELASARKGEGSLRSQIERMNEETAGRNVRLRSLRERILALEKKADAITEEVRGLSIERDRTSARCQDLERKRTDLEEALSEAEFAIKDHDWRMKESLSGERKRRKERDALVDEFHSLVKRCDELSRSVEALDVEIKKRTREMEALRGRTRDLDGRGYTPAVAYIMEEKRKGKVEGVHGTVFDLITFDERYLNAVTVAGGQRLGAVVVEDDGCASACINLLKRAKKGRAIFLPLNRMLGGKPRGKAIAISKRDGILGFASDVVETDPRYEKVLWYVFSDTLLCRDLDAARRVMGGVRLVTLDGDLIEAAGAMIGGSIMRAGGNIRAKINALGRDLRQLGERFDAESRELAGLQARRREVEARISELNMGGGPDPERMRKEREALLEQKRKAESDLAAVEKEMEGVQRHLRELDAELDERGKALASIKRELGDLKDEVNGSMPEEMQARLNRLRDDLTAAVKRVAELSGSLEKERQALASEEEARSALRSAVKRTRSEVSATAKRREATLRKISELGKEISELEARLSERSEEERRMTAERTSLGEKRHDLEVQCVTLENRLNTKRDRLLELKMKREQVEERLRSKSEELAGLDVEVDGNVPGLKEIMSRISECEARLKAFPNVNLKAIEDYDTESERYANMEREVKRLEDERSELFKLRRDIEVKKREELLTIFRAIDTNFREIFASLTGGGEAHLELEDPKSPFNGGLLIKVRPKGQVFRRSEALSGGQKSLTALVFMFAIQRYTPSPFYILDEADMNLDAINAELVARTIKESADAAQFIQISLRKVTLKYADHIIGVYPKRGHSEIVMKPNVMEDLPEETASGAEGEGTVA